MAEPPPPKGRHCWHTDTRPLNMCDYCCRCGIMAWTTPGNDTTNVLKGHGSHHPMNRVPDPKRDLIPCYGAV